MGALERAIAAVCPTSTLHTVPNAQRAAMKMTGAERPTRRPENDGHPECSPPVPAHYFYCELILQPGCRFSLFPSAPPLPPPNCGPCGLSISVFSFLSRMEEDTGP